MPGKGRPSAHNSKSAPAPPLHDGVGVRSDTIVQWRQASGAGFMEKETASGRRLPPRRT